MRCATLRRLIYAKAGMFPARDAGDLQAPAHGERLFCAQNDVTSNVT
jgi:hypothetical protein